MQRFLPSRLRTKFHRGNVHFTIIEMIHLDDVGGAVFDCSADICLICRPPPDGGCLSFEKAAKIVCQGAPDHAIAYAAACWRLRRTLADSCSALRARPAPFVPRACGLGAGLPMAAAKRAEQRRRRAFGPRYGG
jgi:hypothetical protein